MSKTVKRSIEEISSLTWDDIIIDDKNVTSIDNIDVGRWQAKDLRSLCWVGDMDEALCVLHRSFPLVSAGHTEP